MRYIIIPLITILLGTNACNSKDPHIIAELEDNSEYNFKKAHVLKYITIKEGDTLTTIAKSNNIALRDIIKINHLVKPSFIYPGQKLKLPAEKIHQVKKGDNILLISEIYNVKAGVIAYVNKIDYPYDIYPGQILKIPHVKYIVPQQSVYTVIYKPKVNKTGEGIERIKKIDRFKLIRQSREKVQKAKNLSTHFILKHPRGIRGFMWPVNGPIIARYGRSGSYFNEGINIATKRGAGIKSMAEGKVIYAGSGLEGYGNLVIIEHSNNYMSAYAHMQDIIVTKGQKVKQSTKIGTVGTSGNIKTPQLHFSIRYGKQTVDPDVKQ